MADQPIDVFDKEAWSRDQRQYFEMLDDVASESKDMRIGNGNALHATYLIRKFFEHAKARVRLLSGELVQRSEDNVLVYGNPRLVTAAADFLEKPDTRLEIALISDIDASPDVEGHPIVSAVRESERKGVLRGELTIRKVAPEWLEQLKKAKYDFHWMTVDDEAYRLEFDLESHKAWGNFKDRHLTKLLADHFDRIFSYYPERDTLLSIQPAV